MISFTCYGKPIPQGSPRIGKRGNKATILLDSEELREWRKALVYDACNSISDGDRSQRVTIGRGKNNFELRVCFTGPVLVYAKFFLPKPGCREEDEIHMVKPDLDKLQRAVGDALTDARVFRDDCQIVGWPEFPAKVYSEEPRVEVRVEAYVDA